MGTLKSARSIFGFTCTPNEGCADELLMISATRAAVLVSIFVCFVSEVAQIKAHAGSAVVDSHCIEGTKVTTYRLCESAQNCKQNALSLAK